MRRSQSLARLDGADGDVEPRSAEPARRPFDALIAIKRRDRSKTKPPAPAPGQQSVTAASDPNKTKTWLALRATTQEPLERRGNPDQLIPARRRTGLTAHLGWGLGGFLLGAICWHFVGFWQFMGGVMYHGPPDQTGIAIDVPMPYEIRRQKRPQSLQSATPPLPISGGCTLLVLDRASQRTRIEACGARTPARAADLAAASASRPIETAQRQDRAR